MNDRRIRLFVALELPVEVREALAGWAVAAVGGLRGLRLVVPESLHVTLCFLGGQDPAEVEAIAAVVRAAVSGLPAPILTVDEAIWLPRRRPRVLAVGLHDPSECLLTAQGRLSDALAAGGWYRPEKRAFLGHVTVARVGRDGISRLPLPAAPPALEFPGERVTLFRSRLGPAGARYQPLGSVRLAG